MSHCTWLVPQPRGSLRVSSDGAESRLMRSRPEGLSEDGWAREVDKGLHMESSILRQEGHVNFKGPRKAGDNLQPGGVDGTMWVRLAVGCS